jgi:hypothetical protein
MKRAMRDSLTLRSIIIMASSIWQLMTKLQTDEIAIRAIAHTNRKCIDGYSIRWNSD